MKDSLMKKAGFFSLIFLITLPLLSEGKGFTCEIKKDRKGNPIAIIFETHGKKYQMLSSALRADKYLAYFAAEDFKHKKEMVMGEFKEIKIVKDEERIKGVKTFISLKDQNNEEVKDYILQVNLAIRKEFPCLAVYSKLIYKGSETTEAGFNWGISGDFRYYACPERGRIVARKLEVKGVMEKRATKLGKGAYPWVWPTSGKGDGLGIMTVGMLVKNPEEKEIVITDVPPKKRLKKGDFMDVPFILFPTTKEEGGLKALRRFYERVKKVKWEMEDW
ncbi:hypothetical protein J7K43_08250 [Candidatus Calescamantes bacterium]|nr:hypothetical protein [Candidatus Calescamantes bacterium]